MKLKTERLGHGFWSDFRPATEEQLRYIENRIGRKLDPEFCEFYRTVGFGSFRDKLGYAGCIYSPEEIAACIACPIYFITGSMTQGAEWASLQEQEELWLSRGLRNPSPKEITEEAITLEGVKLYDLLQIGNNGCCCYHQLYVGPEPAHLRYCLLTDSREMEDRAMTFSAGLEKIVGFYMQDEDD